jgi:hypothetical protein
MMSKKSLSKEAWLDHLSRQERSDATQQEYCRKHGLSLSAFWYWKKRRSHEAASEDVSFIELPVTGAKSVSTGDVCTIEFPNGCCLRVHAASRMPELAQLVAMVRGL